MRILSSVTYSNICKGQRQKVFFVRNKCWCLLLRILDTTPENITAQQYVQEMLSIAVSFHFRVLAIRGPSVGLHLRPLTTRTIDRNVKRLFVLIVLYVFILIYVSYVIMLQPLVLKLCYGAQIILFYTTSPPEKSALDLILSPFLMDKNISWVNVCD